VVTLAYFHYDVKVESVNDKLNNLHKGYLSIDAASLRSLGFNKSGPIALEILTTGCKNINNIHINLFHTGAVSSVGGHIQLFVLAVC
jgi:hypothetical protein